MLTIVNPVRDPLPCRNFPAPRGMIRPCRWTHPTGGGGAPTRLSDQDPDGQGGLATPPGTPPSAAELARELTAPRGRARRSGGGGPRRPAEVLPAETLLLDPRLIAVSRAAVSEIRWCYACLWAFAVCGTIDPDLRCRDSNTGRSDRPTERKWYSLWDAGADYYDWFAASSVW